MLRPRFRDYRLLLDDQTSRIIAITDAVGERVHKIGGTTLGPIGHVQRLQHAVDNDAEFPTPQRMLAELRDDDRQLTGKMREAHELREEHGDIAGASLLENCIDEAERRTWFLCGARRVAWRSEWIDKPLIDPNSQTKGGSHDQHEKRDRQPRRR